MLVELTYQLGAISTPADVDENKTGTKSITKNSQRTQCYPLKVKCHSFVR